jgi:hypothetical protein
MSITWKQREAFIERMIPSTLLQEAIDWIAENLPPEEVFSIDDLSEWALENEFLRLHPVEDEY